MFSTIKCFAIYNHPQPRFVIQINVHTQFCISIYCCGKRSCRCRSRRLVRLEPSQFGCTFNLINTIHFLRLRLGCSIPCVLNQSKTIIIRSFCQSHTIYRNSSPIHLSRNKRSSSISQRIMFRRCNSSIYHLL